MVHVTTILCDITKSFILKKHQRKFIWMVIVALQTNASNNFQNRVHLGVKVI
jgi:hypothetical protein